jgi:hypothetical protein
MTLIVLVVSSAVRHSTHNPKFEGLSPASGTGREKRVKKFNTGCLYCSDQVIARKKAISLTYYSIKLIHSRAILPRLRLKTFLGHGSPNVIPL